MVSGMGRRKSELSYTIDVLTNTWKVIYLPKKKYIDLCGNHSCASADVDEREIYVRIDMVRKIKIAKETVAHELGHAYFYESGSVVMDITSEQMEELCCDIIAKYAVIIHDQAGSIVNAYKTMRGEKIT